MSAMKLSTVVLLSGMAFGCSAMGPKANVSLIEGEVKAKKNYGNIAIPNVTGIDSTGNTGKALLATALKAYGDKARPVIALSTPLKAVPGLPQGFGDVLLSAYQIEFVKVAEEFHKNPKNKPQAIALTQGKLKLNDVSALKTIVPGLKNELAGITELSQALAKGDAAAIAAASNKSKAILPLVQSASNALLDTLKVDYVLLSHVIGDEKAWEGKKEVELVTGLVNVKTGKLRYFASVKAKKGSIPVPYMAQLGAMSSAIFDSVGEKDPIPEAKDQKNAALDRNNYEIKVAYYNE